MPDTSSIAAPFGDCKRAVLSNTQAIQNHGALLAVDRHSQVITACSDNLGDFCQGNIHNCLGQSALSLFGPHWPRMARLAVQTGRLMVGEITWSEHDTVTVIGHQHGDHLIFEFERGALTAPNWWDHAARTEFMDRLSAARRVDAAVELLVDTVARHSGLDRVMCYRFLPGWHGEVIHECCRPGVEGYLGLRFPASDLPANARQMFTLNWHRMIADVDQPNVAIRTWGAEGAPDMTYSVLRAVHPVHIQYLGNMGVQASITLSLVINGKLWGIIAGHHLASLDPGVLDRLALEEMAKMVALHLRNLLGLVDQEREGALREKLSLVRGGLQASGTLPKVGLANSLGRIRELFVADGIWLHFNGEDHLAGLTPTSNALEPLRDWLDLQTNDSVAHYDVLPEGLTRHPALGAHASGLIYLPLGPADFLVLLRREVVQVVNWAGRPASTDADDRSALNPRNSFATWVQQVHNTSLPWNDGEVACADKLRSELMEYISIARLEQVALHDALTGLPNRLQFGQNLQREVQTAFTRATQFAVHMIDLDKFKPVNDTLGHAAGDALLKAVATRILGLVRTQDTVARLGGDEFAVIQAGVSGVEGASIMAERLVLEVARPYEILGHKVEIGASVGVALFPSHTSDEAELMSRADLALYAVKKAGRNAFSIYEPTMTPVDTRGADESALLSAIAGNQLELAYQPIVDARSGEMRGLEAFIRWRHPELGLLLAGDFLPMAERLGLMLPIGDWVLGTVFAHRKAWLSDALAVVPVSVNISTAQLMTGDLLGSILALAEQHGVDTAWLRLDIKEEAILRDVQHAVRKLTRLRENNVAAQLDNFGRGFVSLGFMSELPFIGLKFDVAALRLEEDEKIATAVLQVIRGVARLRNTRLAITRVESPSQLQWLVEQDVDLLQGYAVSRPGDYDTTRTWLSSQTRFRLQVPTNSE